MPGSPSSPIERTRQRSVEALFILGDMLERGGEAAAAQVWWQRATETGDMDAMYECGHRLRERGDEAGARVWWERAADQGHEFAREWLGYTAGGDR